MRLPFRRKNRTARAHVSADHSRSPGLLEPPGLRVAAAVRHGSGRRHLAHGHLPASARPRALASGLRAAIAAAEGWPLRREPESHAALLPVPGGAEALTRGHSRSLPGIAESAGLRSPEKRCALRRGQLGKPDARRVGL